MKLLKIKKNGNIFAQIGNKFRPTMCPYTRKPCNVKCVFCSYDHVSRIHDHLDGVSKNVEINRTCTGEKTYPHYDYILKEELVIDKFQKDEPPVTRNS